MPRTVKRKIFKPSRKKYAAKDTPSSFSVRDTEITWDGGTQPAFLNLARVISIHTDQIEHYGGTDGVRDMALLQSALAQPEASFGGHWLHEDIFEMAAAYAFHICKNHPFFDGNKRTALVTALVFLEMNDVSFSHPKEIFLGVMLAIAEGRMNKKELAQVFRDLPRE